jgi:hypothetical protein
MKKPFRISEKIIISFYGKKSTDTNLREYLNNNQMNKNNKNIIILKNDFNIISQISKNIQFSYYGKQKNTTLTNNININPQKNLNDKKISLNNLINKSNNYELIMTNQNNSNINNFEEKKEENSINDKIIKKSKKYKQKNDKIFDINKPTVNAVISLDIPSDIQYEISGIQKQYNMMRAQLKRKKNRQKKLKSGEDHQRYYELYKNPHNRVYNGTFDKRLKYFQETSSIENDINKRDKNIFNKFSYNCSGALKKRNSNFDIINIINYNRNNNNINNINFYTRNIISDYNSKNSKNNTFNNFIKDKVRSISERGCFRDKVTRNNSGIIFPCNHYNNNVFTNNHFF